MARQAKVKKNDVQVHDSDRFTEAASAYRRQVASLLANGNMPRCLIQLNIGELRQLAESIPPRYTKLEKAEFLALALLRAHISTQCALIAIRAAVDSERLAASELDFDYGVICPELGWR